MLNISYMDILLSKQVFLISVSQNYLYLGSLTTGYSQEFPGGPAAKTALLMQGTRIQSLVRKLDPTYCNLRHSPAK